MEPTTGFFDIERQAETVIVIPTADMGELDHDRINLGMKQVLDSLSDASVKNLVLDFHRTTYFGSTALGFFVRLWKTVCTRRGHMAFCNVSEHEREILTITKLDDLWEICSSRDEAVKAVRK